VNPEVIFWYSSAEHVRQIEEFIPAANQPVDSSRYTTEYAVGNITQYRGTEFAFNVIARDTDDCTELVLHDAGIPTTFAATVCKCTTDCVCPDPTESECAECNCPADCDHWLMFGYEGEFTEQEVMVDFPEFPEGMQVKREFTWGPPTCGTQTSASAQTQSEQGIPENYEALVCTCQNCDEVSLVEYTGGNSLFDTRDAVTRVCFFAYDKYLVTNDPFYCIDLILIEEPVVIELLEECYCRTCTTPGERADYVTRPTPNYAPKTAAYMGARK
jgi:hypothetical protein